MKVLFIVCSGIAGSNVSLKHTIEHLLDKGVEAVLLAPNKGTCDYFDSIGIETHFMSYFPSIWPPAFTIKDRLIFIPRLLGHFFVNKIASRKLKCLIRKVSPDIIHTNVSLYDLGFKVSRKLKIPHVWHIREYITKDFGYHPIPSFDSYCKQLNNSNSIVISKDLVRHFKLNNCYRVIYNGILDEDEKLEVQEKGNYMLYVGRLDEGKGIASLIKTYLLFAENTHSHTIIKIAGSGTCEYVLYLKSLVTKSQVSETVKKQVVFLGQRSDINKLMAEAKCLIVPSISEAFGRITAEAMFNNCLVIGRNTAGTKEQFDNGYELTGREIGLRYNDNQELEKAMARVDSGEDFSKMIEDAFFTVSQKYTPQKNAENIYQYYLEIINHNYE